LIDASLLAPRFQVVHYIEVERGVIFRETRPGFVSGASGS
jgi:hypothetical protein